MKNLLLVCILILDITNGNAMKCTKISECGCRLEDGRSVDLYRMAKTKSVPMFIQKTPEVTYLVDLCRDFECGDAPSSRVCESISAEGIQQNVSIGRELSFKYNEESRIVTFIYEQSGSTVHVILHCIDADGIGTLTNFETLGGVFTTTLSSSYACWTSTSKRTHELSIGSIICISLVVVIFIYIACGIVINKFVREVEQHDGDVFPNKKSWKRFSVLVKDGCLFTWRKLRGKDSYELI